MRLKLESQAKVRSTIQRLGITWNPVSTNFLVIVSKHPVSNKYQFCNLPLYPWSAKNLRNVGALHLAWTKRLVAPSRSWMLALCTSAVITRPSVSTIIWRFLPFIFLPASYPLDPLFESFSLINYTYWRCFIFTNHFSYLFY